MHHFEGADFSLNATISKARVIKLNDGLAIQVFWDFANGTKNNLFCVSMVSTNPEKNISKIARILEETSHIFREVEPKNEYRIWISLCPLDPKNNKYYATTHQVYIIAP
ncbi:unnamed protein product [Gordionus sp. m RMFG-2023]